MSIDGQGTLWRRNIGENFNRLSRVHQRYRQTTDRRQTDGPSMTYSEHELEFTYLSLRSLKMVHFFARQCKLVLIINSKSHNGISIWHQNRRAWMTMSGVMAVILRISLNSIALGRITSKWSKKDLSCDCDKNVVQRIQLLPFSDIS